MVLKVAGPESAERPRLRSFTVDEYERMIEAGILCEDEHVELLEGVVVEMAPMGAGHTSDVHTWHELIDAGLPPWAAIRVQSAIRLPPDFEPEPDLAVVHRRMHRYRLQHPGPEDILLLVEVADTSLRLDREVKIPRYSAAGIPETWLWDLPHQQLVVFREPKDGAYTSVTTLQRGDSIAPSAFPQLLVAIADVLD